MTVFPIIIDGPKKGRSIPVNHGQFMFAVSVQIEITPAWLIENSDDTLPLGTVFEQVIYHLHRIMAFGRTIVIASTQTMLTDAELFGALLPAGAERAVIR